VFSLTGYKPLEFSSVTSTLFWLRVFVPS
jgi:hypothetical protein